MRICVLIVDDEDMIAASVARAFSKKWTIVICTDGPAALEILLGPAEFDAILLDLMMPVITGTKIYEILEEKAPARCNRIIFFTAGAGHPTLIPWLNKKARPVLYKPVVPSVIEHTVMRVARMPGVRGPREEALVTSKDTRNMEEIDDDERGMVESIRDKARFDLDDDGYGRSDTGSHIIVPADLEKDIEKVLRKREQDAALRLAAGRWDKLIRLVKWGWWRLLVAAGTYGSARIVEELAKHGPKMFH